MGTLSLVATLLLMLFVLMKGLAPVIAAQALSGGISVQEVRTALHGVSGFGKALLAGTDDSHGIPDGDVSHLSEPPDCISQDGADQHAQLRGYLIPDPVDLVVLVVPKRDVCKALRDAAQAGARAAVVISAGFKEVGGEGELLDAEPAVRPGLERPERLAETPDAVDRYCAQGFFGPRR